MGIPHLFTHLGPYGVDTLLTGIKIIIDGPSFAYHIHSLCSSNRAGQVSHKLLCDAAISWLDALSKGSKVTAIYFDGYLPASKHPVRLDRLLKSSTRLQNLHSSNPKACPSHLLSESDELIPTPFPTTYARREPPHHPPFLVPAILERLRLSEKYAPLIRLVPGEADAYCADHALHHGGCVLTSDSDLLVHDLGPRGAVILFRDLRTGTLDGHRGLIAARYSPASIAERLRLPPTSAGIQRFAHELSRDPYKSLPQHLQAAQQRASTEGDDAAEDAAYETFLRPYRAHDAQTTAAAETFAALATPLDPRVSELVLQSPALRSRLGIPEEEDGQEGHRAPDSEPLIFLPLLMDCPARPSAWEASLDVRRLGYALLRAAHPFAAASIREYRRVQSASNAGKQIPLWDDPQSRAEALLCQLQHAAHFEEEARAAKGAGLLALTLRLDMAVAAEAGRDAQAVPAIKEFFAARAEGETLWSTIHLAAQVQACYYSLRILSQILSLLDAVASDETISGAVFAGLKTELTKLPALEEYPAVKDVTVLLDEMRARGQVKPLAGFVGVEQRALVPLTKGEEKERKKEKKRKADAVAIPVAKRVSSNPFDILGEEC
ncbi:hypothetical protein BN1708_010803 [Verticillium longisporum]|uniref:Asteroid domain-containing protein n=1 Tax=Verticillium longisporum TaxID=100787 RepID=A0A0G4KUQ9_VERLO|nr:hypothetical protein BN1708_010803 [Verticillium longisporum]